MQRRRWRSATFASDKSKNLSRPWECKRPLSTSKTPVHHFSLRELPLNGDGRKGLGFDFWSKRLHRCWIFSKGAFVLRWLLRMRMMQRWLRILGRNLKKPCDVWTTGLFFFCHWVHEDWILMLPKKSFNKKRLFVCWRLLPLGQCKDD